MENNEKKLPDDSYPEPIPLTPEERADAIAKVKAAFRPRICNVTRSKKKVYPLKRS